MRSRTIRYAPWILAFALVARPAAACPNCKDALADQPSESASLARGFNWSILVMLGVPFSILGVGGLVVRRAVKRGVQPEM